MKAARKSFALPRKLTIDSLADTRDFKFVRLFAILSSIFSIVFIVLSVPFYSSSSGLRALADIGTKNEMSSFNDLLNDVLIMFIGGVIVLISSIGSFWTSQFNRKRGIIAFSIFSFIGVALLTAGAVLSAFVISDMAYIICEDENCNPRDGDFSARQLELVALETAVFDSCCVARHQEWSIQASDITDGKLNDLLGYRIQSTSFGLCPKSGNIYEQNCKNVIPAVVATVVDKLSPLLCTCAPDDGQYAKVMKFFNTTPGSCSSLEGIQITLDDKLTIPTTTLKFLSAIATGYSGFFASNPQYRSKAIAPLVGSPAPPLNSKDFPTGGFGCGLGMTKGFFWYTLLYVDQNLHVIIIMAIVCAVVSAVTSFLTFVFLCMTKRANIDLLDYEDAHHHIQTAAFRSEMKIVDPEAPNGRHSDGSNSSGSSAEKTIIYASQRERDDLERRLTAFYLHHEPARLVNGVVNPEIVKFALGRGVAAINEKLREKYDADLDSFESSRPPSGKEDSNKDNVIAEKIVKRDVDDLI